MSVPLKVAERDWDIVEGPSPEELHKERVKLRREILEVEMEDPAFGHETYVSARTMPRQLLAAVLKGDEDRIKHLLMDSRMPLEAATTQYSHMDTRTPLVEAFATGNINLIMALLKWRCNHVMVGINEDVVEPVYRENNEVHPDDEYAELIKYAAPQQLKESLLIQLVRRNVSFSIIEQFRPMSRYLELDRAELGETVVDVIRKAHNVIGNVDGEFYTAHDYARVAIEALRYGHCALALDLAARTGAFNELILEIIRKPDYQTAPLTRDELTRTISEFSPYFVPHAAAAASRVDVLEWYCEMQSNALALRDEENWTPIHYAAAADSPSALNWIIAKGGTHQVTLKNLRGETPLHVAVQTGRLENVKILIAAIESLDRLSANPDREFLLLHLSLNWRTSEGLSALHLAARMLVLALSCRPYIDFYSKNNDGLTPIMIAAACGHFKCVEILMRCVPYQVDNSWRDALTHAAINGQTHIVGHFLKSSSLPHDAVDHYGNSALHYACAYGWFPIVKLYANADSSVLERRNRQGLTPANCAFRNGHFAILSWQQCSGLGHILGEDPEISHQSMQESIAVWMAASGASEME